MGYRTYILLFFSCLYLTCTLRIKVEHSFAFFCALAFLCAFSFLFLSSIPLLYYEAWSRYPFWKPFEIFHINFGERKDIICSSSVWMLSCTLEGAEVTSSEWALESAWATQIPWGTVVMRTCGILQPPSQALNLSRQLKELTMVMRMQHKFLCPQIQFDFSAAPLYLRDVLQNVSFFFTQGYWAYLS